jgi:ATP-dependent helicase/nuclease subunit A
LRLEQARIVRVDLDLRAVLTARRTGWLLTVGWAVIQAYERLKGQHAALDFDDLIERTRRLLATSDGVGWVLFKLDQRIEHVLVDEAQDTSPAQWELITRLTDEFFAGAGARERRPTLFVVGDEKQSIYRFQGADLAHLRHVHAGLRARAAAAGEPLVEETLDLSFRSSRAVLELVDAVLRDPEARQGVVEEGVEVRHESSRAGAAGLVELWPLAVFASADRAAEPWPLPGTAPLEDEPQRRLADAIARQVRGWIDAGEVLPATGRPLRAGDVLILLQRRGEMQELLVRALKRREVPVAGADRLALTGHIAVRDLVALGRAMLLPEDDLNLACLLRSPLVGLDEEALLELAAGRGERSLMEQLRAAAGTRPERFAAVLDRLSRWLARVDFQPPFEFYVQVLGADGGRAQLLERLGREALEPVEAFLGQALAYEEGHPASLEGFLHWLELDEQELKRDPEQAADAVRVMTVHGAKGLEAPVVILADAGPHGDARRERLIWTADGLPLWRAAAEDRPAKVTAVCAVEEALDADERRRLLYVALTRAKDRLYVAGWLGKRAARALAEGKRAPTAWHDHVRQALQSLPGVATVPLDLGYGIAGEGLRLARGASAPGAPAEHAGDPVTPPLPEWAHRAVAAEIADRGPRAASRLVEGEPGAVPAGGPDGEAHFRFGRHAHRLLQLVPDLPAASRAAAVDRYLARQRDLDAAERERMRRSVLAVLDHPALAPAFAPGARAEQAICGVVDGIAIAGQIDRLAVGPTRVLLVDFKTGRRGARVPAAYLRQMAAYRALLRQIYPDRSIEAVLVWTETATVEPLESGLLDAHMPKEHGCDQPVLEAPERSP